MTAEERFEFDVVCVGSGAAGVTAAIAAHEYGLSVLVIEKSSKIGGVAAISGGQLWVPANHLAEEAGIADSVEEGVAHLMWFGGGLGDEARARRYCTYARQAVRFLADRAGVAWQIVPASDDYHDAPESHHSLGLGRLLEVARFPGSSLGSAQSITRGSSEGLLTTSGRADVEPAEGETGGDGDEDQRTSGGSLLGSLVKAMLDRQIGFWTDARATSLLAKGGRVSGVLVERNGTVIEIAAARGVVLATGGYDSSATDRASFDAAHEVSTVSLPSVTGDHFRLAGRLGARIAAPFRLPHNFLEPDVAEVRADDGVVLRNRSIFLAAKPHGIIVNRHGRRFHNETTAASRDAALIAVDVNSPWCLANFPCWAVWDTQHVTRYLTTEAMNTPGVIAANTMRELAVAAGINPDGLETEIARFNANASRRIDPDFGRGGSGAVGRVVGSEPTLGAIEQAPFYAVGLVQRTMGLPHAGLVTDDFSRVLDWDDAPIEGLYAAGGAVAFLEGGLNYTPGSANARSVFQGFSAGSHLGSRADTVDS